MSKKSKDARIIDEWRAHYADRGFDAKFPNIIIPEHDSKLFRPVLMPAFRELPQNATLALVRKNCDVVTYVADDNLDRHIIHNARSRTLGSYVILVRKGFEPDEAYLGRSTNEVDPYLLIGMNVRERMILGDKVLAETKKHLDVKGWTLCTGSRYADGNVPYVRFYGVEVHVYWDNPDDSDTRFGLREAVC